MSNYIPTDRRDVLSTKTPKPRPLVPYDGILREALSEAFDEGVESPYDLKDDTIERIVHRAGQKIGEENTNILSDGHKMALMDGLFSQCPSTITEILETGHRVWLSGSQIVRMLLGHPSNTQHWIKADWDIFCHKDDLKNLSIYKSLQRGPQNEYTHAKIDNTFHCWVSNDGGKYSAHINVVAGNFEKAEDVVKGFDFQFLRNAYYFDSIWRLHMEKEAWSDLKDGIIRLNPNRSYDHPTCGKLMKLRDRVFKYIGRGFRDYTSIIENGPLRRIRPATRVE